MTSLDFASLLREEQDALKRERASPRRQLIRDLIGVEGSIVLEAPEIRSDSHGPVHIEGGDPVCVSTLPPLELEPQPKLDLDNFRVGDIPSIYYIPDFVSEETERSILAHAYAVEDESSSWVKLRTRRLQCWGGQPGPDFRPGPLPPWTKVLCDNFVSRGLVGTADKLDHLLLNEYQPGQGIMPHTDGPYYAPLTATLSLGSDAIMHFSPRVGTNDIGRVETHPLASVVLRNRSLVVFTDEAYTNLMHSIDDVGEEAVNTGRAPVINIKAANASNGSVISRRRRVSLTFRRVVAGKGT